MKISKLVPCCGEHSEWQYLVEGQPINGHDWKFTPKNGALYVNIHDEDGHTIELAHEPSRQADREEINIMSQSDRGLIDLAWWAHSIAEDHLRLRAEKDDRWNASIKERDEPEDEPSIWIRR